jgi:hypothetical protein
MTTGIAAPSVKLFTATAPFIHRPKGERGQFSKLLVLVAVLVAMARHNTQNHGVAPRRWLYEGVHRFKDNPSRAQPTIVNMLERSTLGCAF